MAPTRDPLVDLELRRLQLEEQVSKLRAALRHWQTWDAEYEGLKEDLDNLSDDGTREDIIRVGRELDGTLVTEEEVKALLGAASLNRTKNQIIGLLNRRIDYVQQNARTVEKQLGTAQEKLKTLLVVQRPDAADEDGLPLTEIVEELGENGEVLSSTTRAPGDAAPEILETLRKAGMKNLPEPTKLDSEPNSAGQPLRRITELENSDDEGIEKGAPRPAPGKSAGKSPERGDHAHPRAKAPSTSSKTKSTTSLTPARTTSESSTINVSTPNNRPEDAHSEDQDSDEDDDDDDPGVAGVQDTPEEARQRQEMLQYSINGLSEVGAVVAELEIDEEGVDDEAIDLPLDEMYDVDGMEELFGSDDSEEEDEHGRSTVRMIDDDYRQQMRELEERLTGTGIRNLGPDPKSLANGSQSTTKDSTPPSVEPANNVKSEQPSGAKKKKKVAFADDVDIAPSSQKPKASNGVQHREGNIPPTMQESIVERQPQPSSSTQPSSKTPKKPSRFKSVKNATQSTGPELGNTASPAESRVETHLNTVIERQTLPSRPKSPDPNDFDEGLHKQEIATEFYEKRNNMIRRQGGFCTNHDEEDQERVPLPEEDGGPKRMSRFKAARLK